MPCYPGWASQSEVLAGFSRFGAPDMVLREAELARDLDWLAAGAGIAKPAALPGDEPDYPDFLEEQSLRSAAKKAYLRDYVAFGFAGRP